MDQRTRDHVARLVLEARGISECGRPEAAAIVRGEVLTAIGISRLIPGIGAGTSAVIEALLRDASGYTRGDAVLICSRFPPIEDFKALYATDIREVHFIGDIDDPLAATLLNNLSKTCPGQGFRIVQLEVSGNEGKPL